MMQIRQINFFEYLCYYSKIFPVSLKFYGQKIMNCENDGIILLAIDHHTPMGMAFACSENKGIVIYLISVPTVFNADDIEMRLLKQCISIACEKDADFVEYHRAFSGEDLCARRHVITEKGFEIQNHVFSFQFLFSKANICRWKEFYEKRGERILRRLKEKGYELKPFREIEIDCLQRLYSQIGIYFPKELDPRMCDNISEHYSSVVFQHDVPVAFCIVSSNETGREIRIEQLSERHGYINSGAFLLSVSRIVAEGIGRNLGFVSCDVNTGNYAMLNVLGRSLHFEDVWKTDYCVYRYVLAQQ